jgi:hypothetical protein
MSSVNLVKGVDWLKARYDGILLAFKIVIPDTQSKVYIIRGHRTKRRYLQRGAAMICGNVVLQEIVAYATAP